MHPQEVGLVVGQRAAHAPPDRSQDRQKRDDKRQLEAGSEHETEVPEKLGAAREIDDAIPHCSPPFRAKE